MRQRFFRIFFLILALGASSPITAAPADVKVLILGDSLSSAYNIPMERGWVSLLQQRVQEKYPGTRIINASISGETAANAVHRLPGLLERHAPEVLVIELGGNDGMRGIKLPQIRQSLQSLIDMGKTTGAGIVLAGIHLHPNYGPKFNRQFLEVYRQLAERNGVHLVPLILAGIGDDPEKMQGDMTHPTAEAQPAVLENMWPAIDRVIMEARNKRPVTENAKDKGTVK